MKWEYKTIKIPTTGWAGGKLDERDLEEKMNSLGDAGWELVSALGTAQGYGSTRDVVLLFKKARP